mmetsp:Transcript_18601/g.43096  ORF Transcript_18601/g.43096 Transcript_18601/m.43096 type:complete len:99 (+) Transcript_18601:1726-2022(+)
MTVRVSHGVCKTFETEHLFVDQTTSGDTTTHQTNDRRNTKNVKLSLGPSEQEFTSYCGYIHSRRDKTAAQITTSPVVNTGRNPVPDTGTLDGGSAPAY